MKGRLIADRYRLVRELGSGAMGSVWLGEHSSLGTKVAVKLINAEAAQNPSARKRFDREAKIAAMLQSPHVVQVFDHGTTQDGQSYIVMEYLNGETLRERLDVRGRLSPKETAKIVSHVCRAMTKAHDAGLVHRDLKPDNVFITEGAEGEVVKVLDFGVAKATDLMAGDGMDPTRTGALLGTPFYMSPEQAQGKKTVDYRSDLWSLGIMVFECLTGERPFRGSSLGPLVAQIVLGKTPTPSSIAPDNASPEIDEWLTTALAREPEERFSSAAKLAESFMIAAGAFDSMDRRTPSDAPPTPAAKHDEPKRTEAGTVILEPEGPRVESGAPDRSPDGATVGQPGEMAGDKTTVLEPDEQPTTGGADQSRPPTLDAFQATSDEGRRPVRRSTPPVGLIVFVAVVIIVVALAWAMTR